MFSGAPADPPADDFITRNASDTQQVGVGWWPGDARWDETLGEYVLDWDDVRAAPDPHATAVEFLRSAFHHAYRTSEWSAQLGATAEGTPPPVR